MEKVIRNFCLWIKWNPITLLVLLQCSYWRLEVFIKVSYFFDIQWKRHSSSNYQLGCNFHHQGTMDMNNVVIPVEFYLIGCTLHMLHIISKPNIFMPVLEIDCLLFIR